MRLDQLVRTTLELRDAPVTCQLLLLAFALLAATPANLHAQPAHAQPAHAQPAPISIDAPDNAGAGAAKSGTQAEPFTIEKVDPAPVPVSPVTSPSAAPAQPTPLPSVPRLQLRDDEQLARDAQSDRHLVWFGYQTLIADVSSIALMIWSAGSGAGSGGVFALGLCGFLLASPVIDAIHGSSWGWASAGLRAGSLLAALLAIVSALSCFDDEDGQCSGAEAAEALAVTSLGLAGTAIVLDAVFARARPSRSELPSLAIWGDPRAGNAGFSVTITR